MNRKSMSLTLVVLGLTIAGCASTSTKTEISNFDDTLQQLCPVSLNSTNDDQNHVIRGRIVLAAIAGYSYRTIDLFSPKGDVDNDVAQALNHIKSSYKALESAKNLAAQGLFPVYRADYIDELARAAAIGAQPAVRLARTLITGTNADRVRQGTTVVTSLVEDELYRVAYVDACGRFAANDMREAEAQANKRIELRCNSLRTLLSAKPKQTDFPDTFCSTLDK